MRYFLSLIALSIFSMSPAAKAAEDPSLDTLFGFTNQPPKSGDQPQDQKEQPTPSPAPAPAVASPAKPAAMPKPEPLFGGAQPEPKAPQAPVVQTPEPKPVAPVRVLPTQMMQAETPKQEPTPPKSVVAKPNMITPPADVPSKTEIKAPKAPEIAKPAPVVAPVTPVHEDRTVEQPAAPVTTPEPIKAEAESPAPSVVKEAVVTPKAKTKPKATLSKRHTKKKLRKKEPTKMVMSNEERRQKTRQMLEKSYDNLSMSLRIDFPAFSSALPRQSKVDLQDRVSTLKPEELVVLYGSASIGPKGTPNAARAVGQSRMDRVGAFLESLGVQPDRIVTIDRSFTRQDSVDMAFVVVKAKRDQ